MGSLPFNGLTNVSRCPNVGPTFNNVVLTVASSQPPSRDSSAILPFSSVDFQSPNQAVVLQVLNSICPIHRSVYHPSYSRLTIAHSPSNGHQCPDTRPHIQAMDHNGTIVSVGKRRDYRIKKPSGRVLWCNRRFLRPDRSATEDIPLDQGEAEQPPTRRRGRPKGSMERPKGNEPSHRSTRLNAWRHDKAPLKGTDPSNRSQEVKHESLRA